MTSHDKITGLAGAVALAVGLGLTSSADAGVIHNGGFQYSPSNTPFNLEAAFLTINGTDVSTGANNNLSNGTELGGNLVNNAPGGLVGTEAGNIAFKFTNADVGKLYAVNFSTSNPNQPYADLRISWCTGVTATGGCTGEESFLEENLDDKPLTTFFANPGDMKWLVASWSSVTGSDSDLDFSVTAAIPLPAAGLMLLGGLGGLAALRRRKRAA